MPGIDRGYLSRMLAHFAHNGLIERDCLDLDRRARPIRLTQKGRILFEKLDRRQAETVRDTLAARTGEISLIASRQSNALC